MNPPDDGVGVNGRNRTIPPRVSGRSAAPHPDQATIHDPGRLAGCDRSGLGHLIPDQVGALTGLDTNPTFGITAHHHPIGRGLVGHEVVHHIVVGTVCQPSRRSSSGSSPRYVALRATKALWHTNHSFVNLTLACDEKQRTFSIAARSEPQSRRRLLIPQRGRPESLADACALLPPERRVQRSQAPWMHST